MRSHLNTGSSRKKDSNWAVYKIMYQINRTVCTIGYCLVDRGANGCIIGKDMTIVHRTDRFIDLTGIEDHTVSQLNIAHAAFVAKTNQGYAIFHVYQGAYVPDGKSILSPLQLEANGCKITDKPPQSNNGEQPYVESPDGYRIPLSVCQGLVYADIRPVRESEWDSLPHVHLTSDAEWDPSVYDHEVDPKWE